MFSKIVKKKSIDLGNGSTYGQITVSNKRKHFYELFDNMSKHEELSEPSCSMIDALEKQSLQINSLLANIASLSVYDLLVQKYTVLKTIYLNIEPLKISEKLF